jgi:chromate reductase
MSKKVVGIFAGSLRKDSFSKKIGSIVQGMAPEGYEFRIISLENLPVYNQDFDDEEHAPESYVQFRTEVAVLDGFIFITPEHNRTMPAVLKNAIDIASRPKGKNLWNGKPGAVFSSSPGNLGGFGANHHLRQCLVCLNTYVMAQPEIYLSNIAKSFDEEGNLQDAALAVVQKGVDGFIKWMSNFSK